MNISTYSFADVSLVLSHPAIGKYTLTGQGLGSVTVSRAVDNTAHDVAADGSVMVSKIVTKNGSFSLAIQQTSEANNWLTKAYNYLMNAPTSEWAKLSGVLSNPALNETTNMSGVSFVKKPDKSYQQTGQQIQWAFLAAEING